jgi:hypothetical protein
MRHKIEPIDTFSSEPIPLTTEEEFPVVEDIAEAEAEMSQPPAVQDGILGNHQLNSKLDSLSSDRVSAAEELPTADAADDSIEVATSSDNSSCGEPTDHNDLPSERQVGGEPSLTDTTLAVIQAANGIDRHRDDSAIVDIEPKQFNQRRLDHLFALWDKGIEAFILGWEGRCELVYEIHKETAKAGCNGGFSAALRRLKLAASTAYDMIAQHKIKIKEMADPDAPDSRDEVAEQSGKTESGGAGRVTELPTVKDNLKPRYPKVVLTLNGEFAEAVAGIQSIRPFPDRKRAIEDCVIHMWRKMMARAAKGPEPAQIIEGAANVSEAA